MTSEPTQSSLPPGVSNLRRKLHPNRFSEMSGQMVALLAYVLEDEWTTPPAKEVIITSDSNLMVNGQFFNAFTDWVENPARLFEAAELNRTEREAFIKQHVKRVESYRANTEQTLRAMLLDG